MKAKTPTAKPKPPTMAELIALAKRKAWSMTRSLYCEPDDAEMCTFIEIECPETANGESMEPIRRIGLHAMLSALPDSPRPRGKKGPRT